MLRSLRSTAREAALVVSTLLVLGLAHGEEKEKDEDTSGSDEKSDKDEKSSKGSDEGGDTADVHVSLETSGYADTDHVYVTSPTISLGVEDPVRGWSVSGRYLVDIVSAASADIVATASPHWNEVRHVGSLEGTYKPGDFGVSPRASVSREPDYLSLGAGLTLLQDLDEKSWNLALGYGYGHDTMSIGSTPFSVYAQTLDRHGFNASASTILDRATRITFIGDLVLERGELSKLYRYVPVFEPSHANVPANATIAQIDDLRAPERPQENVPDSRNRFALTVRLAHRFSGWTLRGDERLYTDNWGLLASTTDARCMIDVGTRFTIWLHLRGHFQNGVTFWKRVYEITTDANGVRHIPTYITGNRELSPQRSLTLGGGFSWALGPDEDVGKRRLSFLIDGMGSWFPEALLLTSRYGVFSSVTYDITFD